MDSVCNTTMVYGKDLNRAFAMFDEITKNLRLEDIHNLTKNRYIRELEMKDGTIYFAAKATEYSRMYRFNKAYIDLEIDEKIIDNCILPYGLYPNLGNDQVIYFDHSFNLVNMRSKYKDNNLKCKFVQESVLDGYIFDSEEKEIVILCRTKRPDLGFDKLIKLIDKANQKY